ncbi:hypothetical protein QM716_11880 [Rhodococcus sp. IEGM 1409]|uniref:hypothetical protein n=1 Tax=Rhodococcus sp. IEGM 1409 TaxID=3047082 RepID=UPI0024B66052|nr:hypothetical protein [Rhodococcus sp. IEGM 1409]MDI9900552.1 hypothetical protein [Rhodococcus sp. IEGM 1409]
MPNPLLIASDMEPIKAYRRAHPEARHWAHMTPRSINGVRGYSCSEVKILGPVTITEEMFAHIELCLLHLAVGT